MNNKFQRHLVVYLATLHRNITMNLPMKHYMIIGFVLDRNFYRNIFISNIIDPSFDISPLDIIIYNRDIRHCSNGLRLSCMAV